MPIELRQDEDAPYIGMEAVADRDVDQPVLAANGDCGFGAELRQRKEATALTAPENQREHFVVHRHAVSKWYTGRCNIRRTEELWPFA